MRTSHKLPYLCLKDEHFIGLNRMYPNYSDWLLKSCRRWGFNPQITKEADGAASALAFVAAGFGVAVVSEPLQRDRGQGCDFPRTGSRGQSVDTSCGSMEAGCSLTTTVASQFVAVLVQASAGGNGGSAPQRTVA